MGIGGDLAIVVVGAGFGGVAATVELQRHGFDDITLLDAAPGLGGTWLRNDYPGAACDVPSHLYSLSYAQRRDWSRLCSPQPEILGYLRAVAASHGVQRRLRPRTEVTACTWDETVRRWAVTTADGARLNADAVVLATGQLNRPAVPRLAGADTFTGHSFHSARWDHGHDLHGRRVAVIGTGASAVQFVPEIAPAVAHLTVFQRTGNWLLPRHNRPYPRWVRAAVRRIPGVQAIRRGFIYQYGELLTAMIRHPDTLGRLGAARSARFMRSQLPDDDLRRAVWPDHPFGCKRVLFSSQYLPTLRRGNVTLVTDPIEGLTADGVLTADGTLHEVDTIIYGTGFATTEFVVPMTVTGVGGLRLTEAWAAGPRAHLGSTVPGFPSMFLMYGPNTNTSGGSILVYLEAQARYLRQALQRVRERRAAAIEVRRQVAAASDRALQARFRGTAWTRCDSWYRDRTGRVVTNWPGYMRQYVRATATLDPAEFRLLPRLS